MSDERNRLLVGQIALDLGLLTQEKLQECLDLQASAPSPKPLGEIMLGTGALTPGQWESIREEQLRRLSESVPYSTSSRDTISFGRLLVKEGLVSQEVVDQGLRAQQDMSERGSRKRLGEILVEAGHLKEDGVRRALWLQGKALLGCTFCGTQFNVLVVLADNFPCKRCAMPLGPQTVGVRADESAYLLPAVRTRPTTIKMPAPKPDTRVSTRVTTRTGTQTFRRKKASAFRSVLAAGVLALAGALAFLAARDTTPPPVTAADPGPALVKDPVVAPPVPVPVPVADPVAPAARPLRRLTVELHPSMPAFQGLVGVLSPDGTPEGQQEVRGVGRTQVSFEGLVSGRRRVVFLPRLGALPEVQEVEVPESGDLFLVLKLRRAAVLQGTVLDHAREPVAGARVTYTIPEFMPSYRGKGRAGFLFIGGQTGSGGSFSLNRAGVLRLGAVTDRAGRFVLEGMPQEAVLLQVGQEPDLVEFPGLVPGEDAKLRLPERRSR